MGNIAEIHAGKGKPITLSQIELQDRVLAHIGPDNLLSNRSGFWLWKNTGVWELVEDKEIKQIVKGVMPSDEVTASKVDAVTKLVDLEQYGSYSMGDPFDGINCLNGELVFEHSQWTLRPHKKERYQISQIPVEYDPSAEAPRFTQYLEEVFLGDDDAADKTRLVLELMGYSLLTTASLEKFVILVGSGGNGKSKIINLLEKLCGTNNVVSVSPDKLDGSPERAELHGKLANIVSEVPQGAVVNDAALKAITSGEALTAAKKFRDHFTFHPYATCWFGTNHMPHTRDFSNALFRRASVLLFNREFDNSPDKDVHLDKKLAAELPGVLNMVLQAVGCVFLSGVFTNPKSSIKAIKEWRAEADQARSFFDDRCQMGGKVFSRDIFDAYCEWAADDGRKNLLDGKSLTNRLKMMGGVDVGRVSINGKQGRGLNGLSLRDRSDWDI